MVGVGNKRRRDHWKHIVAGTTAGLVNVLALHPLDVIKTRLQVQDGAGNLPLYKGTLLSNLRIIVREEGWRALYAGLTPAIIGSGVAWGIYFFAYNQAKDRYRTLIGGNNQQPLQQPAKLGPVAHLASAAEAGSLVCFVTNPIWVAKTRLQLQRQQMLKAATAATKIPSIPIRGRNLVPSSVGGTPLSSYTGFLDCLVKTARAEGIGGLYRGLLPSLFLVSHGAIQFAVYEELKSATPRLRDFLRPLGVCVDEQKDHALSSVEITACGALSKLAASVATYPSQVVRSRLQQRMDVRAVKYKGILDVVRTTLAREGVSGFYKGLVPNVLRVMPQSALTFLVYETIMQHLEMQP